MDFYLDGSRYTYAGRNAQGRVLYRKQSEKTLYYIGDNGFLVQTS